MTSPFPPVILPEPSRLVPGESFAIFHEGTRFILESQPTKALAKQAVARLNFHELRNNREPLYRFAPISFLEITEAPDAKAVNS